MSPSAPLDLTPVLGPERSALLELLRGLQSTQWECATECEAWTVKGLALHILGDDLSLLSRQRDASANGLMLFAENHPGLSFRELLDGFNEQWVAAARFFSTDLLVEWLRLVGDWSEAFYRDIGLETVSGEPVGFFAATQLSPYWQVIAREYVERVTHQSQIRRAVAAPDLDDELVTPAARVVAHVLAAWLSSYAAPAGATITLDLNSVGTWTLERDVDRWTASEGAPDQAAAQIAVPRDAVVAALTRGLAHDEVLGTLSVTGDEALARGAISTIAPLLARPQA